MSFSIIKPGLLDTIQDLGRNGYGNWGIPPGGAMDSYAAQVANLLVGNNQCEAVIEIHFPGPQILFEQNTMIAITGADFSPTVNDELIPRWQPVVVRKNTVLHFPTLIQGSRCYLSVHGGYCMKKWLNSFSTSLKAGAGGWGGMPLKKGDELPFNENTIYFAGLLKKDESNFEALPWRVNTEKVYQFPHEIGVTPGHEWPLLSAAAQAAFAENNFLIHPSSDRMGYQLKGNPLNLQQPLELVSSAVSFGTVQLLPDGQLIVLGAAVEPLPVQTLHMLGGRHSIKGWPSGTCVDSEDTMKFAQLSGVRPLIETMPLERAQDAYDRMMSGNARFRMVLTTA